MKVGVLKVLVKTFPRCCLFDSCWIQGESNACSMPLQKAESVQWRECIYWGPPGHQEQAGFFQQQRWWLLLDPRLQVLLSFWCAASEYGRGKNCEVMWFWHDLYGVVNSMAGLNRRLLFLCLCFGDTWPEVRPTVVFLESRYICLCFAMCSPILQCVLLVCPQRGSPVWDHDSCHQFW